MTPHYIRNKLCYQSNMLFLLICAYFLENFDLKPLEKKFRYYNMNSKQSPINPFSTHQSIDPATHSISATNPVLFRGIFFPLVKRCDARGHIYNQQ